MPGKNSDCRSVYSQSQTTVKTHTLTMNQSLLNALTDKYWSLITDSKTRKGTGDKRQEPNLQHKHILHHPSPLLSGNMTAKKVNNYHWAEYLGFLG